MTFCPAIFDLHVLTIDEATFFQALVGFGDEWHLGSGRPCAQKSNPRRRLLCACHEGRCYGCGTKSSEKFPSPHANPQGRGGMRVPSQLGTAKGVNAVPEM